MYTSNLYQGKAERCQLKIIDEIFCWFPILNPQFLASRLDTNFKPDILKVNSDVFLAQQGKVILDTYFQQLNLLPRYLQ